MSPLLDSLALPATQLLTDDDASPIRDLILHHIAPGLGCLVALAMFTSPLQAVLNIKKNKQLGEFNPLPLIAIIANCTSWMIYGCIKRDPYVIAANEPGLMLGFFMSFVCYGFSGTKVRDTMLTALLGFCFIITSTCIFIALAVPLHEDQVKLAGYLAVIVLLIYYAAPLSVLYKVLATCNSGSLHWPMSVMCCVNGSLWVAYGLAVSDMFIYGPNAVGAALGVIQLLLVGLFPSKAVPEAEAPLLPEQDGHVA